MINKYKFSVILLMLSLSITAQNTDREILSIAQKHNLSIIAKRADSDAMSISARTGNSLPDPQLEYMYKKGAADALGSENEFTATQGFDFPTVYVHKGGAAKLRGSIYNLEYRATVQEISLEVLQTINSIRELRQMDFLLSKRYQNAEFATQVYHKRLAAGSATAIEENKILMESLSAQSRLRANTIALNAAQDALNRMCGGIQVLVSSSSDMGFVLPEIDQVLENVQTKDLSLKSSQSNIELSKKQKSIAVSSALPKFEVGYKRQWNNSSERFNGVVLGLSIPIFESRNTIRMANAQMTAANANSMDIRMRTISDVKSKYNQAKTLGQLLSSYGDALDIEAKSTLLQKALNAGQISILEYFVEQEVLYQTLEMYLGLKSEYETLLIDLNKYEI